MNNNNNQTQEEIDFKARLVQICPILKKRAQHFSTKKSFGQNFLISDNYLEYITDYIDSAYHYHNAKQILEIGPGIGFLTDKIIYRELPITVIDLDKTALAEIPPSVHLKKINGDAVTFDYKSLPEPTILTGNLPFNVATKILTNIIGEITDKNWNYTHIPEMIFMFQLEVAQRLAAQVNSKEYNQLSILIQAKCDIEFIGEVPHRCFQPTPKVKGGIVKITPKVNSLIEPLTSEQLVKLQKVIKHVFHMRRKVISNSLKTILTQEQLIEVKSQGIDLTLRPQNLSLEDYITITKILN